MKTRALLTALVVATTLVQQANSKPLTYPQLIAIRYPTGMPAPVGVHRPKAGAELVDASRLPAGAVILSAARAAKGVVWVVTDKGAFHSIGADYDPINVPAISAATHLAIPPDTRVTCVASDSLGHIWAATNHGLYITDGGDWWSGIDRQDGMPYDILNCVHVAANGDVWGGTPEGAWRLRSGKWRYFWGKRWMPGNVVSAIWSDAAGRVWLETDGGLGCIEEKQMTLAEKAAYFDRLTQERHIRRGYVANTYLVVRGEPDKGHTFSPADSEGIWTGLYVSAMSLRYAATHDPQARAEAQRSMNAMLEMERLTGIPGYPARALITEDEIKAGMKGWDPNARIHGEGKNGRYWVRSPVDPNVWCKTDTSSDSMDGHFFAWFCYYEYAADAADKERIAAVVRRAADHILNHHFTLVGHTGLKTRWGVWGPQFLNDDPNWFGQRGLNSIELLSHLKVAYHVTGDEKYARIYDEMISKYHYAQNTLLHRRGENALWWDVNHGDDQLAFLAYYPLLILEKDPLHRNLLTESLARTWEPSCLGDIKLKEEHSSFYNFAYGAMTGNPCAPGAAIQDLQDWPWDPVDWKVMNSRRHDVHLTTAPAGDVRSKLRMDRVLTSAEQPLKRWSGDPWYPDGNGDGFEEFDGGAWLIGYWLGVYHGYVNPAQ